jgi:hypothetical protein
MEDDEDDGMGISETRVEEDDDRTALLHSAASTGVQFQKRTAEPFTTIGTITFFFH